MSERDVWNFFVNLITIVEKKSCKRDLRTLGNWWNLLNGSVERHCLQNSPVCGIHRTKKRCYLISFTLIHCLHEWESVGSSSLVLERISDDTWELNNEWQLDPHDLNIFLMMFFLRFSLFSMASEDDAKENIHKSLHFRDDHRKKIFRIKTPSVRESLCSRFFWLLFLFLMKLLKCVS